MSIGNSPKTDRRTADESLPPAENDRTPDEEDRLSTDDERSATEDTHQSAQAADAHPSADDKRPKTDDNELVVTDEALLTSDDAFLAEADDSLAIGTALRRARTDAGMTVDDISTATRVRIPIVHAIEQDDFSGCGGDVYARGHIKTLARAVALDPEPLLAQFDAEFGTKKTLTPATPLFEAERIRPERRSPNWTAAMVAAIVAVIGFVGFTLFQGNTPSGSKSQAVQGANPAANNPAPKPSHTKPAAPRPDPTDSAIAAAPRDKVTVTVNADARAWISAKDHNGQLLFDGSLQKGDKKTFQDDQKIDLVLGNAGAIQLFVNGKKIENEFQPGQVERLSYTKGDPEVG